MLIYFVTSLEVGRAVYIKLSYHHHLTCHVEVTPSSFSPTLDRFLHKRNVSNYAYACSVMLQYPLIKKLCHFLIAIQVGNLGLLFLLMFFIFAALGMELFGQVGTF